MRQVPPASLRTTNTGFPGVSDDRGLNLGFLRKWDARFLVFLTQSADLLQDVAQYRVLRGQSEGHQLSGIMAMQSNQ
jgi:hypothetical protein